MLVTLRSLVLMSLLYSASPAGAVTSLQDRWNDFMDQQRQTPPAAAKVRKQFQLDFIECFIDSAERHQVPVALLLAVAKGESNFNPRAVSNKDAVGLMQIRWPITANHLGVAEREQLFTPCVNVNAGAKYLASLLARYDNDVYLALGGYYMGPSSVSKGHVPNHAAWYADYIWGKVEALFGEESKPVISNWQPERLLFRFTSYLRARQYWRSIEMDTGVEVEVLKEEVVEGHVRYFYKVVLSSTDAAEEQEAIERIKAAYYKVKE